MRFVSIDSAVVHPSRDQLIRIGDLIDTGRVKPIVDTILPLSEARQVYEGAKGVHKRGKIVLRVR
jgi:NADPH:quinone reductase-like Zn-dependent oxidoreductase